MTVRVSRDEVLRYRARASHLDRKLAPGSFADAAYGGLQDSIPRAGVISLHARVTGCVPTSWDDPSLAQIWFRGGADYIVPRTDVGVFTIGSLPRDTDAHRSLEHVADAAHRVLDGRVLKVREVTEALGHDHPMTLRAAARTGRLLIRWNASMIWLIACERPSIDPEDARLELARRFLRWLGPQTHKRFAWWAAIEPSDAAQTWNALAGELGTVVLDGEERSMLIADVDTLVGAEPVEGVRLVPIDDPYTKIDRDLLVADLARRELVFPPIGTSLGYIPGAVVVDGEIAGVWQRQQRRVTIHPWQRLPNDEVEAQALNFPIAGRTKAEVRWEPIG